MPVKRVIVLVVVLALAAVAAAVARGLQFRGVAKPGVHVLGVDVGGKSRAEIQESLRSWSAHAVTIHTDGHTYHVPRGWLVKIDARSTATRVLAAGSTVSLVVPERVDVEPVARPAGGSADVLRALAKANRDPVSATVTVQRNDRRDDTGTGRARARPGGPPEAARGEQRIDRHAVSAYRPGDP